METIEKINDDFNVKKTRKKGFIIAGIIVAILIIAIALVYFLVFSKPQFIFNKAIDKLFETETREINSIKFDTNMKISIETDDESVQHGLDELEKCTIKVGAQLDGEEKKEIVNLGLEYDKESVIDAQLYYNNGELYSYFDEIFDKYIQIDMDEEQKNEMKSIFEVFESQEEQDKKTERAMQILRDEIKTQIEEEGTFEKESDTINIGEKEKKVTKNTLVLSQKAFYNVISNICTNLAKNDEFLDCFEDDSLKDSLKEFATAVKEEETNSKNNIKISIYTKGLFNEFVGVNFVIYSQEEDITVQMLVVKENKNTYSYNIKIKSQGVSANAISGTIQIEKEKDSKDEQKGKITISMNVSKFIADIKAKIEMDYSVEYNKGVDKINVKDSIKMEDLTEEDMKAIMEELEKRPLIGELISNQMNGLETNYENNIIDGIDNANTQTLTTLENEVKDEDYGYSVTYSVPTGFEYENYYSDDYIKYYILKDENSEIEAKVSLGWYTDEEYKKDIDWDYNYYKDDTTYYKNVVLGEVKAIKVGDKDFKYQILSYESNSEYYSEKYQKAYVWYNLDDEYIFTLELEASDKGITEDIIKGFLNISVKEI